MARKTFETVDLEWNHAKKTMHPMMKTTTKRMMTMMMIVAKPMEHWRVVLAPGASSEKLQKKYNENDIKRDSWEILCCNLIAVIENTCPVEKIFDEHIRERW
jgi:hypothetical protein